MGDIYSLVRGDPSMWMRHQTNNFDPTRGWLLDYYLEGASYANGVLLQNDLIASGVSSELTLKDDKASLKVSDPTQEFTIDSWEIVSNNEVRDLFSHPDFVSAILANAASAAPTSSPLQYLGDVCSSLRTALAAEKSVTKTFVAGGTPSLAVYLNTIVSDFYLQYYLGDTGFKSAQYVVRHKTNVSNRWSANIADFGVNMLYSPAAALNEMSNSGLWIFPLPGRLQYKLASIISPAAQTGYLWSYLKSPGTETTSANNRVDITTEYNLDLWFTEQYGVYA